MNGEINQPWQLSFEEKNQGRAWVLGSDISTDAIISGKYLEIRDFESLSKHVLEGVVDDFPTRVKTGDVIIAGENFGSGSSREQAPTVLKFLGVGAIYARSFARIFFRNAINIGLPAFTIPSEISEAFNDGEEVVYTIEPPFLENASSGQQFVLPPFPPFFTNILRHGGAIPLLKEELGG
ncbi:MAG TPA: 3-isopropylmalate dehydratase [Candidatus Lokiarchaeia archaeon]|nr:3-isopropylmalate dehydratase [Candidatus Lokiarchaeia archaeon]